MPLVLVPPYRKTILASLFGDPYFNNVELLMHYSIASGARVFNDVTGKTTGYAGGAQNHTGDFKFGTASLLLDGVGSGTAAGSHVVVTYGAGALDFGLADFTVECWINRSVAASGVICGTFQWNAGYQGGWRFLATSANGLSFHMSSTVVLNSASSVIPLNGWHHVAVTRQGNNFYMFVNGALVATTTNTINISAPTPEPGKFRIGGKRTDGGAIDELYNGRIDDLRITKNIARYTASFTAPTVAFLDNADYTSDIFYNSVSNLFHYDGSDGSTSIVDSKGSAVVNTVGTAQLSNGAAKFGGSSLRLAGGGNTASTISTSTFTVPANTAFTIECWIYLNAAGRHIILGHNTGAAYSTQWGFGILDTLGPGGSTGVTKGLCFILSPVNGYGGNVVYGGQYPSLNAWHHVAVTRDINNVWHFFVDGVRGTTANANATAQSQSQFPANTGPSGVITIPFTSGNFDGFVSVGNSASMAAGINAYLDELRVTVGFARYTRNFTVPDQAFPQVLPAA